MIVPVLNEERNLPALFASLAAQRSIRMELVLCDGGSSDDTVASAERLGRQAPFPCRTVSGSRGRAAQQNRGAADAGAPLLLFLHADSSFDDTLALRSAVDALASAAAPEEGRVAGRFPLRFDFPGAPPLPYRFYQAKARLDRPGCTHGDQGFLLSRSFFEELGCFDESLPLMEDTFLAEKIRRRGRWVLFPAPIITSARRFQEEGLLPRQTLNAVLMNLAAVDRLELIADLKSAYRSQHATRRLSLGDFFIPLSRAIGSLPLAERVSFWYRTGSYARRNAWQIPLFLDVLFGNGREGGGTGGGFLRWHDRHLERVTENLPGRAVATLLVWGWFKVVTLWLRRATPCSPARSA